MRLSQKTHKQLEAFFRLYFEDENLKLPKVEIYLRRGAKLITKLIRVDGITLGRIVFVNPDLAFYDENQRLCLSKNLLSHELTHVIQYNQLGFFGFLYKYLKDYFVLLREKKAWDSKARMESYWEIPHEIEARDAAKKFVGWLNKT
jgi:hypothetical protein